MIIELNLSFNSQTQAEHCVRHRGYIVGSIDPTGVLSFSPRPVVHLLESKAQTECVRLSKMHSGKTFIWVQFCGGYKEVHSPQQFNF